MLTDKCKKKFNEWYYCAYHMEYSDFNFDQLPFEMQSGVYLAFFDSVGIVVSVDELDNLWCSFVNDDSRHNDWNIPSRPEALKEAIKQANKIYNENN